jgi:PKD repeat protein
MSAGTYTVTLTVTNGEGSDEAVRPDYITVNALTGAPEAAFSSDVTSGTAPLTVTFTDESTNAPTSWLWDFGDGGTSTGQYPVHEYMSAGTYTVTLTVTNGEGSDEAVRPDYITVNALTGAPEAAFSSDVTSGTVPLTVTFTDESTNSPTTWGWDFGDGTLSDEQDPVHEYMSAGTYTVTLTVTNGEGSDDVTKTGYITVTGPGSVSVSFSPSTLSFGEGETAEYQIIMNEAPLGLAGYDMVVSLANPGIAEIISVAFPPWANLTNVSGVPGQSVLLAAVDTNHMIEGNATGVLLATISINGTASGTTPITIDELYMDADGGGVIQASRTTGQAVILSTDAPIADFSANPAMGSAPLSVQFSDNSSGIITTYAWDFDSDGSVDSTEKDPRFIYTTKGIYDVTLTVSGPGGSDTRVKPAYITAMSSSSGVTAGFSANPLSGAAPFSVQFTDLSVGTVTSWSWDFDYDGTTDSSDRNPVYTYNEVGSYSVTLIVSGPDGRDTCIKDEFITVTESPKCDLFIGGLPTPIGATLFPRVPNTVKIFKIGNSGPESSPATQVELKSSDGFVGRADVPELEPNSEFTAIIVDTTLRSSVDIKVTYTAVIDPDNIVAETNENNNEKSRQLDVKYNGYMGARYWPGMDDINTVKVLDLKGDIVHSFGNSQYRSGSFGNGWNSYTVTWTAADLSIPSDATVREARLYVPYTWDNGNVVPNRVSVMFNGKTVPYQHWYHDVSNFGAYWDHAYGLLTYDVTSEFKKNEQNKALFSRQGDPLFTKLSMYGFTLAVIYEDPDETRKLIFLNEGFDLLGASEDYYGTTEEQSTAYVLFSGPEIDKSDVISADLITFVASGAGQEPGDPGEGNLIVNGRTVEELVWDYGGGSVGVTGEDGTAQVAVDTRDISDYLRSTNNEVAIQSTYGTTPCMAAMHTFLVVELEDGAGMSGGGSTGAGGGGSFALDSSFVSSPETTVSTTGLDAASSVSDREPTSGNATKTGDNGIGPDEPGSQKPESWPGARAMNDPVIPLLFCGFLFSVSGAGAVGLYYSLRKMRFRYRQIVSGILVFVVAVSLLSLTSFAGGVVLHSAFSAGESGEPVSFSVQPVIESIRDSDLTNSMPDYPEGFVARNGLLFVLSGGGSIRLDNLEVRLGAGGDTVSLTSSTPFPSFGTDPSLSHYLYEEGNGDGVLTPGEWLMVYADSCFEKSNGGPGSGKAIGWQPAGASQQVTAYHGDIISYSLYEVSSGELIQEGQLTFMTES